MQRVTVGHNHDFRAASNDAATISAVLVHFCKRFEKFVNTTGNVSDRSRNSRIYDTILVSFQNLCLGFICYNSHVHITHWLRCLSKRRTRRSILKVQEMLLRSVAHRKLIHQPRLIHMHIMKRTSRTQVTYLQYILSWLVL